MKTRHRNEGYRRFPIRRIAELSRQLAAFSASAAQSMEGTVSDAFDDQGTGSAARAGRHVTATSREFRSELKRRE
jgi:hypothetical protein